MRRLGLRAVGATLRLLNPVPRGPFRPAKPAVLLIRPDHLGDLLLTSPAVQLLRDALPEAHLTMMVGPWAEEIARREPALDEVLVCPFPGFTRAPKRSPLSPYRVLRRIAGELRGRGFHAALVLRFDHWWGAWLAAQARIPVRVGSDVPECRPFLTHRVGLIHQVAEGAGRILGSHPERSEGSLRRQEMLRSARDGCHPERSEGSPRWPRPILRHEGMLRSAQHDTYLGESLWALQSVVVAEMLLALWGVTPAMPRPHGLRFDLTAKDLTSAQELLRGMGSLGKRLVVLHPGTGSPLKLWPEEHWIALGKRLAAVGARIVVTGSAAEAAQAGRIAAAIPDACPLAGLTGLGDLAALFSRSDLVVGVDSGALHLAVAVDVPTVHLFGPTDPALFGPHGDPDRHRVVRSTWPGAPCGRLDVRPENGPPPACMWAVDPGRVAGECLSLLGL